MHANRTNFSREKSGYVAFAIIVGSLSVSAPTDRQVEAVIKRAEIWPEFTEAAMDIIHWNERTSRVGVSSLDLSRASMRARFAIWQDHGLILLNAHSRRVGAEERIKAQVGEEQG